MERELWAQIMVAIRDVNRSFHDSACHTHPTERIVRVYLWAVLHDRPTSWACNPRVWDDRTRPACLPSQPTVSRRLRRDSFARFMTRLGHRLRGELRQTLGLLKYLDGRPLTVAWHSADRDATAGYARGRMARGYKLHVIDAGRPMPEAFAVESLNVSEKTVAAGLIPQLTGAGYLLADANYHTSGLFEAADEQGHRLLASRPRPDTGLGHRRHHPRRLDCIDRLENVPAFNRFGVEVLHLRNRVESFFGQLASFFSGLSELPSWVRGLSRVRNYVTAKLLINAARIRHNRA
jgi:hypothetical protein